MGIDQHIILTFHFQVETPLYQSVTFLIVAHRFYKDSNSGTSRTLFRYSLLHLPALMALFLLSKKKWYVFDDTKEESDVEEEENCDC